MDNVVITGDPVIEWLSIIIAVVVCVILCTGGVVHYLNNRNKPKTDPAAGRDVELKADAAQEQPDTARELVMHPNWGSHPSQQRAVA